MEHAAIQILLLLLVGCLVALGARRLKLPYTLALVVTGVLLGFVELEKLKVFHLTSEVLFTFLLPALLFEAAFHLDYEDFRKNAIPILTLAVFGVVISAGLTALLVYCALIPTGLAPTLSLSVVSLFAVVISATDAISVLALFKSLGVPRQLYVVVEGESLLNDGVAVVLFLITAAVVGLEVGGVGQVELHSVGEVVVFGAKMFVTMAGGGALIGAAVGTLVSAVMRQFDDHLVKITLTTVVAYGSFLLAEELGCSGVLSTVTAGIITGSVGAKYGMSPRTRLVVEDFWEYAAFVANTVVFLLMGLVLHLEDLLADAGLVAVAFLATVVGRAVAIYVASPVLRVFGKELPWTWSHVLVWGGLRGSVSMVLVLGIAPEFAGRETLIHLVFGVVSASLLVQGLTIGPLLSRLGLSQGRDERRIAVEGERARILGMVAAQQHLQHLSARGLIDADNAARLTSWFQRRREGTEASLRTRLLAEASLADQRLAEMLVQLLDVEREAVRHAARIEVVHRDAATEALQRLDNKVAVLRRGLLQGDLACVDTVLDEHVA